MYSKVSQGVHPKVDLKYHVESKWVYKVHNNNNNYKYGNSDEGESSH